MVLGVFSSCVTTENKDTRKMVNVKSKIQYLKKKKKPESQDW